VALLFEGPSRQALAELREQLGGVPAGDRGRLAEDLFATRDAFTGSLRLQRALTDTSSGLSGRQGLAARLLSGKVGDAALALVRTAVGGRWTETRDLGDALEAVGDEALLMVAEDAGELDRVEDDLFRFIRILDSSPQLSLALSDPAAPSAAKGELIRSLLGGKAADVSTRLVERAVLAPTGLPLDRALADVVELAAARRMQLVATVRSARPLDAAQTERLAAALRTVYGKAVQVQADVDPTLIGGLTVHVGGQVVDGSVLRRLEQARAALAR